MTDHEFGAMCGRMISLALNGNEADMRETIKAIEHLVALQKMHKLGIRRDG